MADSLRLQDDCALGEETLVQALRWHAESHGQDIALTFTSDREQVHQDITYRELDKRVRSVISELRRETEVHNRVLLLYPPGIDYVVAFLACLYAKRTAVPVYPPHRNRSVARLEGILHDSDPACLLCSPSLKPGLRTDLETLSAGRRILQTNGAGGNETVAEALPRIVGRDLAFLQYTSGTVFKPRGVEITHANLRENARMIRDVLGVNQQSVVVSWLPPYHDMGLIGSILQPLWSGAHAVLMPPAAFLLNPVQWLRTIERFRGTVSGAPDFAYALCAIKASEHARDLDLRSWKTAFNGSETVREETLTRFSAAFCDSGFDPHAFLPCYGLAEATLFVSGARARKIGSLWSERSGERSGWRKQNGEKIGNSDEKEFQAVSCGRPAAGLHVEIVHPDTCRLAEPGEIGEIWISGPTVAAGYFGQPELTKGTFDARLKPDGGEPFLRTGDLGLLRNGELFIAGRIKEQIVVRGRNFYPQDVEETVRRAIGTSARPACAAFGIDEGGQERLAIVIENGPIETEAAQCLLARIRGAVVAEYEVQPHSLTLVRTGRIPRTSSGKLQRMECKSLLLAGLMPVLACHTLTENPFEIREASAPAGSRTVERMGELAATVLRKPASDLPPDEPLVAFGLDSLGAGELSTAIEFEFGAVVPIEALLGGACIRELAHWPVVHSSWQHAPKAETADEPAIFPLSEAQRAIWFLHQLAPVLVQTPALRRSGRLCPVK